MAKLKAGAVCWAVRAVVELAATAAIGFAANVPRKTLRVRSNLAVVPPKSKV